MLLLLSWPFRQWYQAGVLLVEFAADRIKSVACKRVLQAHNGEHRDVKWLYVGDLRSASVCNSDIADCNLQQICCALKTDILRI